MVGERATGCGSCAPCQEGDYYSCDSGNGLGYSSAGGAYADYVAVASRFLRKLPFDMPLKHGPLVGPVAACLDGLGSLSVASGNRACVVGAGWMGNLCSQILRSWGIHVTVVDPDLHWPTFLFKYDVDTLAELPSLEQFDYLVETSGDPDTLEYLVENSRAGVKVLSFGLPYTSLTRGVTAKVAASDKLIYKSLPVQRQSWNDAIKLISAGAINLVDHTSEVRPLEAYKEAWASVQASERFKVLLGVSSELEAL